MTSCTTPCRSPRRGGARTSTPTPTAGERTRREFIDAYADSDLLVIGTHFGGPGAGRIVSVDGGHELVAVGD